MSGNKSDLLEKSSIEKGITKEMKQERHNEMNAANAANRRLKLGMSRKNYKKLVEFEKLGTRKLEQLVENFFVNSIADGVKLDDDEIVEYFDRYDRQWRDFIRPKVNKSGLYEKAGILEILERFTTFVSKQIEQAAIKKANLLTEEGKFAANPITLEIFNIALEHGAIQAEFATIVGLKDFNALIKELKILIPRGKKIMFEKAAKAKVNQKNS